MTLPVIPRLPFPNVPFAPGVPALARSFFFPPTATPAPLRADAPLVTVQAQRSNNAPGQWGIFDSAGKAAVVADSVVAVEWKGEYRIADYPIEGGTFESYNKVKTPYSARLIMNRGGTDADRTAFIDDLDRVLATLTLYTVTTPEKTYQNANVVHVDYDRTAIKGATLITASVGLEEVRVAVSAQFSQTQAPSGADPITGGTVQPQTPTPSQLSEAQAALNAAGPGSN